MAKDGIDISLLGDKQLQKALNALPVKVEKKIVRQAFVKGARPILKSIRALVPGSGEKHAMLRRGIKSRAGKRTRRASISRFILLPTRAFLGIPASAEHYWPAAVEYGHVARDGSFVAPRSFVRSGYDAKESEAFGIVKREIGDGVAKAWAGK